tara:strand:- start:831 stop:1631 length:801 start_codon:yes stop_codon:yes gene_type:complete
MSDIIINPSSSPENFDLAVKLSKTFAKANAMVPAHFRGKPEDIFVALQTASDLGIKPLMALQQIFVIHGRSGMSGKLIIGLVNEKGPFKGPLRWESDKSDPKNLSVTCYAYLRDEDVKTGKVSVTIDMDQARAEGWAQKNQKYKTMPEQMLRWRSATWLANLYAPEVLMGFPSHDELIDISGEGSTPGLSSKAAELNQLVEPDTKPDTDEGQKEAPVVIEMEKEAPKPDIEPLSEEEKANIEWANKGDEPSVEDVDPSEIHGELFE